MFADVPVLLSQIQGGKIRPLAAASAARNAALPDVPTLAGAGFPDTSADNWYGLLAPARTPAAVVGKLHDAVVTALAAPDLREKLIWSGAIPAPTSAADSPSSCVMNWSAGAAWCAKRTSRERIEPAPESMGGRKLRLARDLFQGAFVLRLQRGPDPVTHIQGRAEQTGDDLPELLARHRPNLHVLFRRRSDEFRVFDRRRKRGAQRRNAVGRNAGRRGQRPSRGRRPRHELQERLVLQLDR